MQHVTRVENQILNNLNHKSSYFQKSKIKNRAAEKQPRNPRGTSLSQP